MRTLGRWSFNVVAAVSLLICLTFIVLWMHRPITLGDYGNAWAGERGQEGDAPAIVRFGYSLAFHSVGGTMGFQWHYIRRRGDRLSIGSEWAEAEPNRAGFAWNVAPTGQDAGNGKPWARQGTTIIPFWFAILLFLIFPGMWLQRFLRNCRATYRARHGLCPLCRYNLTGNISGVCPECGTAIARKIG